MRDELDVKIFGEHDRRVVRQLERCVEQEEGSIGVLCADGHYGYSAPIGGVVVSVSAHMTIEQAGRVRDVLDAAIQQHYQTREER